MMPTQPEDRRGTPGLFRGSPSVPESGVVLPPGYRIHLGVNLLVLRRADGSMVTAFGASSADPAEVKREAEKDYLRAAKARPSGPHPHAAPGPPLRTAQAQHGQRLGA